MVSTCDRCRAVEPSRGTQALRVVLRSQQPYSTSFLESGEELGGLIDEEVGWYVQERRHRVGIPGTDVYGHHPSAGAWLLAGRSNPGSCVAGMRQF